MQSDCYHAAESELNAKNSIKMIRRALCELKKIQTVGTPDAKESR